MTGPFSPPFKAPFQPLGSVRHSGGSTLPRAGLIVYMRDGADSIRLPISELYPLIDPLLQYIVSGDGGTTRRDDADIYTLALASTIANTRTLIVGSSAVAIYSIGTSLDTLAKAYNALRVKVGGTALASSGSGIYTGYRLAGGDDFSGSLDIIHAADGLGRYGTTHVYYPGSRSVSGYLQYSYDMDPYHVGSQDSNRGEAVGGVDSLVQQGGALAIKARWATPQETPHINGRKIVSGMIHSGGFAVVTPPCIVEARVAYTDGNPDGWHPTFWIMSAWPLLTDTSGSLEFDISEGCSEYGQLVENVHGTVGTWYNGSQSLEALNLFGSGFHTYSVELTDTALKYYIDGVLIRTVNKDTTLPGDPYYLLFTNHTFHSSYGSDAGVNLVEWESSGNTGATMTVDWWRVWTPNEEIATAPLINLPTVAVDYNEPMTYTFPSVEALWGDDSVVDYCAALRHEDFEPGASTEGTAQYGQFPAGLTWNSGTRVLSGVTTDKKPGRLHLMSSRLSEGGLSYVARGYVDVGPHITITEITTFTEDSPGTYDLYPVCDCGTLLPKTVAVTNLPSGLSFDPSTCIISGTPENSGTTAVTVTVTNSAGQQDSVVVSMVVASSGTAFFTDTFTEEGTGTMSLKDHTSDSGHAWARHPLSGTGTTLLNRDTDRVDGPGFGEFEVVYTSAVPAIADYTVSADIDVTTIGSPSAKASGTIALLGRQNLTVTTAYWAMYSATDSVITLRKNVLGVLTTLGTYTPSPAIPAGGSFNLKLKMYGSAISCELNDVEILTATDTEITAAGRIGMRVFYGDTANGAHPTSFIGQY